MDEEERWKKESQLMTKDSNATATIHTASISDVIGNKAPQGRIIAITRSRPKDWRYECKPIFAPSWRLLQSYKGGYINYQKFRERYLNEMRHLYRNTTILQEFAKECSLRSPTASPYGMQESVVLCCYCKGDEYCARAILKEILEKIIRKLKQKVEYPIPPRCSGFSTGIFRADQARDSCGISSREERVMFRAVPTAQKIHPTQATQPSPCEIVEDAISRGERYDVAASFERQMETPQLQCEVLRFCQIYTLRMRK